MKNKKNLKTKHKNKKYTWTVTECVTLRHFQTQMEAKLNCPLKIVLTDNKNIWNKN